METGSPAPAVALGGDFCLLALVVENDVGNLSFFAAVERLKANENKEVASLVLRDRALQAVIACWPMVRRQAPDEIPGEVFDLDALWGMVAFDEREVVELSGVSAGLAIAALRRARGNRLIYPDGSVNQTAKVVLQGLIKKAVS